MALVKQAPKGQFRVVGVDSFSWPYEEYLKADFPSLEIARDAAAQLDKKPMHYGMIFNDKGEEVV